MDGLYAYAAGAGTGKTYTICENIAEAITDGLDPARIVATTFTEDAAAELKGRVLARIWDEEDIDVDARSRLAERLELAAIGTVHSVGYQLLKRYAYRIGLSPRLHILDDDASERHLDHLLEQMSAEPWEEMVDLGRPLDQPNPQRLARELLDVKRTNRIDDEDFRDQIAASADRLCEVLAPDGPDPAAESPQDLSALVEDALDRITSVDDDTKTTAKAIRKLRRLEDVDHPRWKHIVKAGKIDAGKRSGADDCLQDLRAFASDVRRMPQLHEDIRQFCEGLAEKTLEIQDRYNEYKRSRGLLDYTDLEDFLLRALERDDVQADLAESFEVVFVDEFQDSNPIQLALFLKLHEAIGQSYWVGDEKQSIYAFRDADLDLVRSAWKLVPDDNMDDLGTSYRSQEGLVEVLGAAFEPIFGDDARLEADRSAQDPSLERWILSAGNNSEEYAAIADGVDSLLEEGRQPGDIAVLTRTNAHARDIGDALAQREIPALVSRPGLLGTRECTTALAGLEVVADRYDSLAAATVFHMLGDSGEDTPSWLIDRLEEKRQDRQNEGRRSSSKPWSGDPTLDDLEAIDTAALPPSAVLEQVIQRLDLPAYLPRWGEPQRRKANLDALVEMARDYEERMEEQGRGSSLRGLITWLDQQAEADEDEFPMPVGLDAVTVSTYHGAKGQEWPTVVLTDLDFSHDADLWEPRARGGHAEEGRPLDDRRLEYWPWPFGTYGYRYGGKVKGSGLDAAARNTAEGQALQEEEEAEADRLLYVGMTRAADRLVLTHRGDPDNTAEESDYEWLARLPIDDILDPDLPPGEHDIDDADTTGVVRHLEPPDTDQGNVIAQGTAIDIQEPAFAEIDPLPRYRQPSREDPPDETPRITSRPLPDTGVELPRIETDDWDDLGDAVHSYLAALPSLFEADREAKVAVAERCLRNWESEDALPAEMLVDAGGRLRAWIDEEFGEATWHTEVPVTAPAPDGRQWRGTVDLLLELPDGDAVIVDHKIRPIPEGMWTEEAKQYVGQLHGYTEALEEAGLQVAGQWLAFVLGGGVCGIDN